MDKSVFDRHHIQFDTEAKTQKEAFHVIAHAAYEAGYVKDENAYFEGMCEREKRGDNRLSGWDRYTAQQACDLHKAGNLPCEI